MCALVLLGIYTFISHFLPLLNNFHSLDKDSNYKNKMLQMYMYQFKSLQLALSESIKLVKFYHIRKHFIAYSMSRSNIKVKTELLKEFCNTANTALSIVVNGTELNLFGFNATYLDIYWCQRQKSVTGLFNYTFPSICKLISVI